LCRHNYLFNSSKDNVSGASSSVISSSVAASSSVAVSSSVVGSSTTGVSTTSSVFFFLPLFVVLPEVLSLAFLLPFPVQPQASLQHCNVLHSHGAHHHIVFLLFKNCFSCLISKLF
jgi:hypothetical protein